ncbi:hypothetical protein LMTR13_37985 [Bradyrhizobium icense]|uniref:Uncharacterized protein n=1 Tax=Bradyrhizobium icense TaxID=1274631 RepID=A0A1B1UQP9_9BRAD|nr:hypothetical protein LMTR13_37985 [Bradyrhizobium icense]
MALCRRQKTGRKIRISGRLWMNSLDALAATAREGANIVRLPSWQAGADLAAGPWFACSSTTSRNPPRCIWCFSRHGWLLWRSEPSSTVS